MPEPLEPIWERIRQELRRETPDFKYHIWLEPLELAGVRERTLYVRAPEHIRSWVGERYLPLLRSAARAGFDPAAVVEVVDPEWSEEPAVCGEPRAAPRTLNPKYTFEQFVIGDGNRFAHAAALAAAELPGQAYNPLFVHGPPGLGKTHLLHAIGNYVERYGSGLRVRYATIEEFTTAFVQAVRERRTEAFKERFRDVDVLLIDDVQFLAHKARTREEFFHTFNALMQSGRQLVVTADCPPEQLGELEDRLAQRFVSGLVVGLDVPGLEVRRVILGKRARLDRVEVSEEVLDEIARSVTTNVRALEGALIRVVAYASLRDEEPTRALTRRVLQRIGPRDATTTFSISEIVDAVAQEFGVRREDLLARDRRSGIAEPRQIAMYLARELTQHSLPEIGRGIGGRNHTTVLHAVNKISTALRADEPVREAVHNVRQRLGQAG